MTSIVCMSRKKYWEAKIDASQTSADMARKTENAGKNCPDCPHRRQDSRYIQLKMATPGG